MTKQRFNIQNLKTFITEKFDEPKFKDVMNSRSSSSSSSSISSSKSKNLKDKIPLNKEQIYQFLLELEQDNIFLLKIVEEEDKTLLDKYESTYRKEMAIR